MPDGPMRVVLGVVAGVVVAFLCIWAIEAVGHSLFPTAEGVDFGDPEQVARMVESLPAMAFLFVLGGWFLGSLLGAWAANAIARRGRAGWIVALLVVAGGVATMAMIPHPVWMWAGGIVLPLAAGWLAQRLAGVPT